MKNNRANRRVAWALAVVLAGTPLAGTPFAASAADAPVAIDSRIRTLVYSANEVFKLYTEYGYQSNIEFAADEQITTISVGSTAAFKITPSGNRLFVKALQKGRHTNMTVLTTKRAYQFELYSEVDSDDKLIYVMRFYYPEDNYDDVKEMDANLDAMQEDQEEEPEAKQAKSPAKGKSKQKGKAPAGEDISENEPAAEPEAPEAPKLVPENYNYSLTGSEAVSPTRVYDNGRATFFKFAGGTAPDIFGVNPDGSEYPLPSRVEGEYVMVDTVLKRFTLRQGSEIVCVFNEGLSTASPTPPAGNMAR